MSLADDVTTDHFQEPGVDYRPTLLAPFLSQRHRYGFFLHPNGFYESCLLPLPLGNSLRPMPALVSVIYLWGIHLSPSIRTQYEENMFLQATLRFLAADLSGSHPHAILHGIQAEILLSYFYLKKGKLLEGNYHANSALTLCLTAHLHCLRSSHSQNQPIDLSASLATSTPCRLIEEGERIDGFWAIVTLNNYWITIQGSRSMTYDLLEYYIDTPWPMYRNTCDCGAHYLSGESKGTVRQFLEGLSVEGFSDDALRAKATILLERSTVLHLNRTQPFSQYEALSRLDTLIDNFGSNLPLFDSFETSPHSKGNRITTQMIRHGATIVLHKPFFRDIESSAKKCLFSARSIVWLTKNLIPDHLIETVPPVDPIIGILWTFACGILMTWIIDKTSVDIEIHNAVVSLEMLMHYMTIYSDTDELIQLLVSRFQKNFSK